MRGQVFEGVLDDRRPALRLGLGWNVSFVAATAQLADRSSAAERGKLLGFNDLCASLLGAGLALLGGVVLDFLGVTALAFGAAAIVLLPVFWIYRLREPSDAPGRRWRSRAGLRSDLDRQRSTGIEV